MSIQIEQLSKGYGDKNALNKIDLTIVEYSITGLIGNNGAGKTTLMKIIAGKVAPTSGQVRIGGEVSYNQQRVMEKIHYTKSDVSHHGQMKLGQILDLYRIFYKHWDKELALSLLEHFSIDSKSKYRSLSLGMKSIFNFIVALATRAEYTLFDEPVLGMDGSVRKEVYDILLKDYIYHPRTMVISSHLVTELEPVLSDVLLLDKGETALHQDIDTMREMATMAYGAQEIIDELASKYPVIDQKEGEVMIEASPQLIESQLGIDSAVQLAPVPLEDLCIAITRQRKGLKFVWGGDKQ